MKHHGVNVKNRQTACRFAFFWGMLMFVFNYVPALGSLLAAIPPVLQTLIFFDIQAGLLVAGFFVMLNLSLSSVMEPLILGKRLNLPLAVQLLAFLIWQALPGITGAILAIPLTFLLKKVWRALRELEWRISADERSRGKLPILT